MVVLNKIYTRTGDKGDTALVDGTRVPKFNARVEAYGTVDELNAALGVTRHHAEGALAEALARIQNDLFDLGADVGRPDISKDAEAGYPVLRIGVTDSEPTLEVQGQFSLSVDELRGAHTSALARF